MKYLWLVGAVILLISSGCKSDSKCEKAASKLRGCGLLEAGNTGCDDIPADEAVEANCLVGCIHQASCKQLDESLCQGEENAVNTCLTSCLANGGATFSCGGGVMVSSSSKCDGFDDCDDGADEKGCKTIACKTGGQSVVESVKCDGFENCDDGSDEASCPLFKCKSGELIGLQFKCDEDIDCEDASDELGCNSEADLICK